MFDFDGVGGRLVAAAVIGPKSQQFRVTAAFDCQTRCKIIYSKLTKRPKLLGSVRVNSELIDQFLVYSAMKDKTSSSAIWCFYQDEFYRIIPDDVFNVRKKMGNKLNQ